MKLKNYAYTFLIFSMFAAYNVSAQNGPDWTDCDNAITQFQNDFDTIVRESSELMYSASGLPDFRDNLASFSRDSYQGFQEIINPSITGAWEAWDQVLNYNEDLQRIMELQRYALDGVADTFFNAIAGKDC